MRVFVSYFCGTLAGFEITVTVSKLQNTMSVQRVKVLNNQ